MGSCHSKHNTDNRFPVKYPVSTKYPVSIKYLVSTKHPDQSNVYPPIDRRLQKLAQQNAKHDLLI